MRIVIALGGNALGNDPISQKKNTDLLASSIINIIKDGHEVVFTHGNGPQVGMINLAFEKVNNMPFPECGAMSQGYIGYHLSNSLLNKFKENDINKKVVSLITSVVVDSNDKAFSNPTKPIGSFYSKEEALKLPYVTKEDAGRGYRRVIASPKPITIVEKDAIISLLNSSYVVISCGGGGIPVFYKDNKLVGVDAVIDKDLSSALLAKEINADMLLILTAVENVCINYKKENEKKLEKVSKKDIINYLDNNEFYEGSMKPKILACLDFLSKDKLAVISNIESAYDAVRQLKGTIIEN